MLAEAAGDGLVILDKGFVGIFLRSDQLTSRATLRQVHKTFRSFYFTLAHWRVPAATPSIAWYKVPALVVDCVQTFRLLVSSLAFDVLSPPYFGQNSLFLYSMLCHRDLPYFALSSYSCMVSQRP